MRASEKLFLKKTALHVELRFDLAPLPVLSPIDRSDFFEVRRLAPGGGELV